MIIVIISYGFGEGLAYITSQEPQTRMKKMINSGNDNIIRYCVEICVWNYVGTCVGSYFEFNGVVSHAIYGEKEVLDFLKKESLINNLNGLIYLSSKGREVFGL